MREEIIRIEHLTKKFDNVTPIKDLSTSIYKGDIIAIIGPSGTGKSTLMRCINMLDKPTSGKIFIGNDEITAEHADITALRKRMGMVFQGFHLFTNLSVVENLMLAPVDQLKISKQEAYDKAMNLLDLVGMADKAYEYPRTLSGGQKQRVAIARALAMDPEILLMDEPTSALDPTRVEEVKAVVSQLAKKGMTMLLVTHEMNFARSAVNRVFYMDEGGIYEEGTPDEIFNNPKKEKTRLFVYNQNNTIFTVNSDSFDYFEALGLLERFCILNRVSHTLQKRVELILEELITNMIVPKIKQYENNSPEFKFTLSCSSQTKINISLSYTDFIDDIMISDDNISSDILTKIPDDITKKHEDGYRTLVLEISHNN